MVHVQNQKVVAVINPVAIVDNTSWTTTEIDTLGFAYCSIYVMLGATDIAMATLKVQESDTSGTDFGDISGTIFGTATNIAGSTSSKPSATDDNLIFAVDIDLRGRKRYLDLVATAGDGSTGTYACAWAVLERGDDQLDTAASRGCSQILRT